MCRDNTTAVRVHYDHISNSSNYDLPDQNNEYLDDIRIFLDNINKMTFSCYFGVTDLLKNGPAAIAGAKAAAAQAATQAKEQAAAAASDAAAKAKDAAT